MLLSKASRREVLLQIHQGEVQAELWSISKRSIRYA